MAHIWWSKVCRLWVRVDALLCTLLHTNLKKDPYEALLCKLIAELLRSEWQLSLHPFTTTKLTIAKAWKSPILSFEAVKNQMNDIMVYAIVSDTHEKFLRIWQPWIAHAQPSRFDNTRFCNVLAQSLWYSFSFSLSLCLFSSCLYFSTLSDLLFLFILDAYLATGHCTDLDGYVACILFILFLFSFDSVYNSNPWFIIRGFLSNHTQPYGRMLL